jgi:hypothetical protein
MLKYALQGYKKALGYKQVNTYIFALNITKNFAMLYIKIGRADKAKDMYLYALYSLEAVLGRSSKQC